MAMWGDNGQQRALFSDSGEPDEFELRGGNLMPTTNFTIQPHFTRMVQEEPVYGMSNAFFCEICGGTNHDTSYCRGMEPAYDTAIDDRCEWGAPWSDQCLNQGGNGYGWNPSQQDYNWDERQGFWEGDYESPGFDDSNEGYGGNQFMEQDSFIPPHPYQEAPEPYYFQPPQSSSQPPQDPSSLAILEMLHQIQAEQKEEKARMRMLETQIAQFAEKIAREAREAQEAPQASTILRVSDINLSYCGSYEEFEEMNVEKPRELEVEVEKQREEPDVDLIQVPLRVRALFDKSLPVQENDPGIKFLFTNDSRKLMIKRVYVPGFSFDTEVKECSPEEEYVKGSADWRNDLGGVHPPHRRVDIFGAHGIGSFCGLHGDPGRNLKLHPDRCKRDLWKRRPPDVEMAHLSPFPPYPPPDVFDDALRVR